MQDSIHPRFTGNGPQVVSANGGCVAAERLRNGDVEVTSSIEGNTGAVTYTELEWTHLLEDAKAGKWDHL
jgi:hypothetical protein